MKVKEAYICVYLFFILKAFGFLGPQIHQEAQTVDIRQTGNETPQSVTLHTTHLMNNYTNRAQVQICSVSLSITALFVALSVILILTGKYLTFAVGRRYWFKLEQRLTE